MVKKYMGKGNKDAAWRKVAASMPPLQRTPGGEYSAMRDQVLNWFSCQPLLINVVIDKAKGAGLIVYDEATGTWRGCDYHA